MLTPGDAHILLLLATAMLALGPPVACLTAAAATAAQLAETHWLTLSRESPRHVEFPVPGGSGGGTSAFRLRVRSANASATWPVLVQLQLRESLEFWSVTAAAGATARTLRPPPASLHGNGTLGDFFDEEVVSLTLSTRSPRPVAVEFTGTLVANFTLSVGSRVRVLVESPEAPQLYGISLGGRSAAGVRLAVASSDGDACARVTLMEPPAAAAAAAEPRVVASQTVLTSGHLLVAQPRSLSGSSSSERGLDLLVLARVLPDGRECGLVASGGGVGKNLSLAVEAVAAGSAIFPASLAGLCFILLLVMVPVCAHICWRRPAEHEAAVTAAAAASADCELKTFDDLRSPPPPASCQCRPLPDGAASLADLCPAASDCDRRSRQKRYCFHLAVVAVFYSLPALQLVLTSQLWLHESGDQDRCYYNFACLLPVSVAGFTVYASSSVLSNMGYVVLGLAFLVCVRLHRRAFASHRRARTGVPASHGLHAAAGLGMVIEGLLSAGYHLCPSSSSFQFDTAFMLVLAGLLLLLVATKRRPDLRPSAHWGCLGFAGLIFLNTLGSAVAAPSSSSSWLEAGPTGPTVLYAVTAALLLALARLAHLEASSVGRWRQRDDDATDSGAAKSAGQLAVAFLLPRRLLLLLCRRRHRPTVEVTGRPPAGPLAFRLLFSAVCMLEAAVAIAVSAGLLPAPQSYSMFLLACLLLSLGCYIGCYLARKLQARRHHRCPLHRGSSTATAVAASVVCAALAAALWCLALALFVRGPTNWRETPAESRARNSRCLALGYFDVHDLWHFASALALFLSFLFLLSIDDDVAGVPRQFLEAF